MAQELEMVVLTHDVPAHGLEQGDAGVVVHCYADGAAFEVEFVTADGQTVGLLTLTGDDIRPIGNREILHVREYTHAATSAGG